MLEKSVKIGEILLESGYITENQLQSALEDQKGFQDKRRLGDILVTLGFITPAQQLEALSLQLGLEVIDLSTCHVDERAVEKIPKLIAVRYQVIAVAISGNTLTVAANDPMNLYALEDIRLVTNMQIRLVLEKLSAIEYAIDFYYSEVEARRAIDSANEHAVIPNAWLDDVLIQADGEQAPIVRILNSLLMKGYNTNVSDIHIEPYETETVIRMRRDGMLLPYMTLSSSLHQALVARVKILAQMDIAEKRKPQDGHFKMYLEEAALNIRVSFIPTIYGEKGVLRYLTTNTAIDFCDTFGMRPENYKKMLRLLTIPYGLIYLTGPTGSGKTTTLYSILQYMSSKLVNIVTIEDPVERCLPRLSQMQVNEKAGVTFETGLRALLRQDPDIIMIGETRDFETANISARAAITGHLVFSTLHTNDAVSSVIRLKDLGLENYIIANSVTGIVAQRLVRKICPYCREAYEADDRERKLLKLGRDFPSKVTLRRGKGCFLCDETGYRGRVAIYEILEIDEGLRRIIASSKNMGELESYAREIQKMSFLRDEMQKLVLDGITSIEEMQKITSELSGNNYGKVVEL